MFKYKGHEVYSGTDSISGIQYITLKKNNKTVACFPQRGSDLESYARDVIDDAVAQIERGKQISDKLEIYKSRWPNFCKHCGATGEDRWVENGAPLGEGYWEMPMSGPCEHCIGTCPRCGYEFDEDDAGVSQDKPCSKCGWNWGKNDNDYAPVIPDGPVYPY